MAETTVVERERFMDADTLLMLLGRMEATHLDLPADLSFEKWAAIGAVLGELEKRIQWLVGDWYRYGEHRYGEAASQAAPTGLSAKSVQNMAYVADRIEPSRRREGVPFSHHAEVAALPPDVADGLLDRVEAEGWTRSQLRAAAGQVRSGTTPAAADPAAHVHRCSCGKTWDEPS